MFKLVRLNEVQYTDSEYQKDRLVAEGFILDETVTDEIASEDLTNSEDLSKLTKTELLTKAEELGLEVTEQNTKAEIIAALQG